MRLDGLSLRLPSDYRIDDLNPSSVNASPDVDLSLDSFAAFTQDNFGIVSPLGELAEVHNSFQIFYLHDPRTLDPVLVDGVRMYHVSGPVSDVLWAEAYGADTGGLTIDIAFLFGPKVTAEQRRTTVDSVLATVDLG